MDSRYCIIIIGYNRIEGINRLFKSLCNVEYFDEKVDLIISLDNCGDLSLYRTVNKFEWPYGDKVVKLQEKRLGLKKHILKCGEYLNNYDAAAVFEDDLVVSPGFYSFMRQAVPFYSRDSRIAGISLYSDSWNKLAKMPFLPEPSSYDVYFFQMAQSWGQIWLKNQWNDFIRWYTMHSDVIGHEINVPENIVEWSDNSWLKYHIKYCIDTNKFFVFPYISLTTCFDLIGEHSILQENCYQVPFTSDVKSSYNLRKFEKKNNCIIYDAFYERMFFENILGYNGNNIMMDIYGKKKINNRFKYVLSTKILPYKIVRSFDLCMRPAELNILYDIKGKKIHLYDTNDHESKDRIKENKVEKFVYFQRLYGNSKLLIPAFCNKMRIEVLLKKLKIQKKLRGKN